MSGTVAKERANGVRGSTATMVPVVLPDAVEELGESGCPCPWAHGRACRFRPRRGPNSSGSGRVAI
jgi:hypothetical protein